MATSSAMSTSNDRVKYKITITQNSQSITNNTSKVTVSVRFYRTNTGYSTYGTGKVYCKINGTTYSANVTSSQKITSSGIVLFTKTLNIPHNADGKKTLTCSAWIDLDTPLTSSAQSYSQTLTTIPRYATSTQSLKSKTETSIEMNWASDSTIDYIWYSRDNGTNWTGINVADGKSGSYTISGLTANTTYKIKTRVRRKESQLTTDSSALSVTTYNYPYCNSSPNFTIGDKVTLGFYNPLGRTFSVYIELADGSIEGGDTISGTSLSGYNNSSWQGYLYDSIPNSKSGAYKVRVTYGSSTIVRNNGNTYTVKGTEIPTINGITYKDTNDTVVDITENDQHIVQNQSNLQINYEQATPNFSAGSIAKYTFELNGVTKENTVEGNVDFGTVNSANDLTLTVTVTDSRGLSAKTELTITMLAHSEPTATVLLERLNNYEDETYLKVDASISSVDGKNTMTVKYRYGATTDDYTPFVTIPNGETQTLSVSKNSSFVFNVVVTDAFGSVFDREYILYKGVFPLFIDTEKNAVGINEFPSEGEALRVAGGKTHFEEDAEFDKNISMQGKTLLDFFYPVNTIAIRYDHINPADIWGGTWVRIQEAFLWATSESGNIGGTGGEKTHTLTTDEMPSHTHTFTGGSATTSSNGNHQHEFYVTGKAASGSNKQLIEYSAGNSGGEWKWSSAGSSTGAHTHTLTAKGSNAKTGGGKAHNNMPPYIQVSVWRRTA